MHIEALKVEPPSSTLCGLVGSIYIIIVACWIVAEAGVLGFEGDGFTAGTVIQDTSKILYAWAVFCRVARFSDCCFGKGGTRESCLFPVMFVAVRSVDIVKSVKV